MSEIKKEEQKKRRIQKRKKRQNKLVAFLFLGMLGIICLINMITKDKVFSVKENRMLQQKPVLSLASLESGRWMEQYETYVSDQFAGRDFWVTLKTRVDLLSGKRKSNGVFKGKDGYLLEDIARPNQEQLQANLQAMRAFGETYQEIPMYMMLAPNAANIESDKLPGFAVTVDQEKQFQKIKEELGTVYQWVDVSSALKAHKEEEIYYHTDHHWTTLGAYYGFEALADTMELDKSKISDMKPYAVSDSFNGTLSSTSGYETNRKEPVYIYAPENLEMATQVVVTNVNEKKKTATLYDASKLEGKDQYALFLGGNYPRLNIKTTSESQERLLLIKDSYANSVIPFLIPYYREIVVVDPRYYYDDINSVMTEKQISSVLFLYNGNTFVEDNSISGVLQNE